MSLWTPYILSLMFACGDGTEETTDATTTEQTAAQPEVAPQKSNKDTLKEWKVAVGLGDLEQAQTLLEDSAMSEDDKAGLQFLMAGAAGWSNNGIDVLVAHQAWAKLIAGDAQGAYDVAATATLKAMAVLNGAKSTMVEEWTASQKSKADRIWSPEESLEILLATGNVALLQSAMTVQDPMGQLALAQWAEKNSQADIAKASFEAATAMGGDVQGYANVQLARFTKDAKALTEHMRKASASGDVLSGWTALDALVQIHLDKGDLNGLWDLSYEALKAEHKMKLTSASWETVALLRVGLMTGHIGDVYPQATKTLEHSKGDVLRRAALYSALLATRMSDADMMALVIEKSSGADLELITSLAQVDGSLKLAGSALDEQVLIAQVLAPLSGSFVEASLEQLLQQPISLTDKVSLTFIQDDYRRVKGADNQAALKALQADTAAYPNLQQEIAQRLTFYAPTLSVPTATDNSTPAAKAWLAVADALSNKKPVDPLMDALWQQTPFHRVGPLSTNTVLDMSRGANYVQGFNTLIGEKRDAVASASLGLLELARTTDMRMNDAFQGYSAVGAVANSEKRQLLAATDTYRAGVAAYWFGADYPTAAEKALLEQEEKIKLLPQQKHLYASTVVSGNSIREQFKTITSVISIYEDNGQYLAGVVSPSVSAAIVLGPVTKINALAEKHWSALQAGVVADKIDHMPGNNFRDAIFGPLEDVLSGVGKYMVIAPPALAKFSYSTLPEQKDGLRYLADKRKVTVVTSLDASWSANQAYADYELDMFAVGRSTQEESWVDSATDANTSSLLVNQDFSPEIGLAKVHYSDNSAVVLREEATVEAFLKNVPKSRYIYLSEVPATEDGGFQMADGAISIGDITNLSLQAMIVFIGPTQNPAHQIARVEAFMQAGAQAVIVQAWPVPSGDLRAVIEDLFMNLKRNDPLMEAMSKTRLKYIKNESKDTYTNNAAKWGTFTIYGRP